MIECLDEKARKERRKERKKNILCSDDEMIRLSNSPNTLYGLLSGLVVILGS